MYDADPEVEFIRLDPQAKLPFKSSPEAAGYDLYSVENVYLLPEERAVVSTGLRISLSKFLEGQVRPRSGLAAKDGVTVLNSPGTIDPDYTGELKVILINHGHLPVQISVRDRIAQIVFMPVIKYVAFCEVTEFTRETSRGENGFGSTGD